MRKKSKLRDYLYFQYGIRCESMALLQQLASFELLR